ncbi:putative ATP-dependent RNA helicase [Martiniozyma asiatica (nom. inval.)]|nr:putative ATP-dependent RNA helicase [Martiniozyma asiatica]
MFGLNSNSVGGGKAKLLAMLKKKKQSGFSVEITSQEESQEKIDKDHKDDDGDVIMSESVEKRHKKKKEKKDKSENKKKGKKNNKGDASFDTTNLNEKSLVIETKDVNNKAKIIEDNNININEEELNVLKRKRDTPINSDSDSEKEEESELNDFSHGHSSVLSRFKQTMSLQPQLELAGYTAQPVEDPLANIPLQNVQPLPQPALPKDRKLYSQAIKNQSLDWLTKPAYYSPETTKPFEEFEPSIDPTILTNLIKEFQVKKAFSVQITLIQELLKDLKRQLLDPTPRGDYLINAATGSGKTLAYLIPIIQSILNRKIKDSGVKCIIIVPTRPLVNQVYSDALKLTKGTDIVIRALRGDVSVAEEGNRLMNELDILITTPGRLMEHIEIISLKSLRFLVVDEADKLLNQSFQGWCDSLIGRIEEEYSNGSGLDKRFKLRCTKLILSATLTTSSEKLSYLRLFKPRLVVVNESEGLVNELYQLPIKLNEFLMKVPEGLSLYKPLILLRFFNWISNVDNSSWSTHGLVFTKSNEATIRLTRLLNLLSKSQSFKVPNILHISSTMKNSERQKILKQFDQNGGILISTDLLSRGINFNSIQFVINYDLPGSTKEYVHRIGRTARGGNEGRAITFCFGDGDFKWFKKIVYSGGVINRNKKEIEEVKFVKSENMPHDGESQHAFPIDITDSDKEQYQQSLDILQKE